MWTAIAVTAPTQEAANEVCSRLPSALHDSTVLLAVPDATSLQVGSGAATLNALLTVAEELSARAGFSTLSAALLPRKTSASVNLLLAVADMKRGDLRAFRRNVESAVRC